MSITRVVMGLLADPGGDILIARRNISQKYGGLWEFPGGKMESGESVEEALVREIREELGADIHITGVHAGYMFTGDHLYAEFIPITGLIAPADIILHEHDDCRFIQPAEMRSFSFSPADYGAIEMIERGEISIASW